MNKFQSIRSVLWGLQRAYKLNAEWVGADLRRSVFFGLQKPASMVISDWWPTKGVAIVIIHELRNE